MATGRLTRTSAVSGNRRGPRYGSVDQLTTGVRGPGVGGGRRGAGSPAGPPPAYYDPAIDSQLSASRRGLSQLLGDISLARGRGETDLNLARGDIGRQRDEGLADLLTDFNRGNTQFDWQQQDLDTGYSRNVFDLDRDYGRGMQDLDTGYSRNIFDLDTGYGRGMEDSRTAESRMGEDYRTAITGLEREYGRLAGRQSQGAAAAGVGASGAFAQAAAKRAENRAIDQAPIDTGYRRGLSDLLTDRGRMTQDYGTQRGRVTEDYGTNRGRMTEDYGTTRGRLGEDYQTNTGRLGTQRGWAQEDYSTNVGRTNSAADRGLADLNLQWDRQVTDWGRQEQRAQDEARFFGQDANQQKWFQARQSGYVAPQNRKRAR